MTQQIEQLTVTKNELDSYITMMDSMLQDLEELKRGAGQEGPAAGGMQDPNQVQPQPSPLSAANLEKQTQALKQAQNAQNRAAGKTTAQAQPPAAPTSSQPPFQFGMHKSPAGNPEYYGEQRITQANLVIPPARKKVKTATGGHASPPVVAQTPNATSSPQVNAASPVTMRKPEPPKLTCPEPGCEMNSIGFATEEALNNHRQEEHIKPYENPLAFFQEQVANTLGLDPQGMPKTSPKAGTAGTAGPSTPSAAPMAINRSKQGQKAGAAPMSRTGSMQRQGSAAGIKAAGTPGTPGTSGTSGKNLPLKQGGGAGTPQIPTAEDPWAVSTIDPQTLFSGLGSSLEAVTGTLLPDFSTYRSLTPNDTPESIKDSGASEPTSDIAEGMALDIDLQLGQPFDNDLLYDMGSFNMDNLGSPNLDMYASGSDAMMFPLDELQNDFSKPFKVPHDMYSFGA